MNIVDPEYQEDRNNHKIKEDHKDNIGNLEDNQSNKREELINNPDNRDNEFDQNKLEFGGHCCIIIDHKDNKQ